MLVFWTLALLSLAVLLGVNPWAAALPEISAILLIGALGLCSVHYLGGKRRKAAHGAPPHGDPPG